MLQNKQLISIVEHDSNWLSPKVKRRAFGVSAHFGWFAHFYDFGENLSKCHTRLVCLVVRLIENFLDMILMLKNRPMALLAMFASNVPRLKLWTLQHIHSHTQVSFPLLKDNRTFCYCTSRNIPLYASSSDS